MKNFLVVVDKKYLINVTANTNGGAEHKILDNMDAQYAHAFGYDELQYLAQNYGDELMTVGFNELAQKMRLKKAAELDNKAYELEKQARELRDKAKALREEAA